MMKPYLRSLVSIALCLTLAAACWACEKQPEVESSSAPVSSAVSTPSPESSAPSSQGESSWFTPAEDLIPSSPEEGSSGFEADFSQNPIDRKYDEDYSMATSFSMMRQACDEAASSWASMVDIAYDAALDVLSGDARTALQQEQDVWEQNLDAALDEIRSQAGEGNEGILTAARQIVLFYRQRAMELCKIKYDVNGELPPFPGEGEAVK